MSIYYAGIGSRETPSEVLREMHEIAYVLGKKGFVLRSGGAPGADKAFEEGCDDARGKKEIYLPWEKFENNSSPLFDQSIGAKLIAQSIHPNWEACKDGARKMHSRNIHQILGADLNTPVSFVLCFTRGGNQGGGTGQALRLVQLLNSGIPIVDFGKYSDPTEVTQLIMSDLKNSGY